MSNDSKTLTTAEKIAAIEASDYQLAWDGCHKIYLLGNPVRVASAVINGYETYPASEIRQIIVDSCFLVFVSNWGLDDDDWDHDWAIDQCTQDIYHAADPEIPLPDDIDDEIVDDEDEEDN